MRCSGTQFDPKLVKVFIPLIKSIDLPEREDWYENDELLDEIYSSRVTVSRYLNSRISRKDE
ncbi:hypothetical protein DXT63_15485 [Thermoanaerobacteraceae bacterium SP2]|nr:hypothetical protein DXT63_15485 [Thermoanaerobacteraceae bacterium SP2]